MGKGLREGENGKGGWRERKHEWIFLEKHQLGRPVVKSNMTKTILFKVGIPWPSTNLL